MFLLELSHGCLVRYTGLVVVLWLGYSVFLAIFEFLRSRLFPVNFKDFGQWAVVTGSTDGIGKGLVRQLAKDGLNIVLISRSEEKLKNTAKDIEKDYHVKTICIQADFSSRDIYEDIEKTLKDLDIAVLVNNVGTIPERPKEYVKFSYEDLQRHMDVNITSAVYMTRIVLPQMKAKRNGYIVNVSSLSSVYGLSYFGTYSSSKAFLEMFTYSLATEMERYNIKMKCLIPGIVRTKMIKPVEYSLRKLDKIILDCDTYVKHAYKSLSSSSTVITGYWMFTFLAALANYLPFHFRTIIMNYLYRMFHQPLKTGYKKTK